MQYLDIRVLVIGKLMHGIFVTIVHLSTVKMINETVPPSALGPYSTSIAIIMTTGYMLTCAFGLGLPSGDYNPSEPREG